VDTTQRVVEITTMLLNKSAFREILSANETKRLEFWKSQIRKNIDKSIGDTVHWLRNTLRKSGSFRQGFLSCGTRDLGHYAVLYAIRTNKLDALRFLIQAQDPEKFCMKRQGTAVMHSQGCTTTRMMPNVYDEDEPYLYTAIQYGTVAAVDMLLRLLGGVQDGKWHWPANGFCQDTTFLSLALRKLCLSSEAQQSTEAWKKVKCLLLHGASPLLPDSYGATSLTVYCEQVAAVCAESVLTGRLYEKVASSYDKDHMRVMIGLLLSYIPPSLGVNMACSRMWTTTGVCNPLQVPAQNGNTWLLLILLERGVEINTVDARGQNALFVGKLTRNATHGSTPHTTTPLVSLNFLIRHGVNPRHIDLCGHTPLTHLLLNHPNSDLLHQKVELLYWCGVDIEHVTQQQETALSLAKALAGENPDTFDTIVDLVQSLIMRNRNAMHHDMRRAVAMRVVNPLPFHLPDNLFDTEQ